MVKENLKRKKKHDRDKYYHLAKEQGYRSRAAFKLIQVNRKYDFLSRARVCIDLCAAPGGWCQVAAKHMPAESIILGVDLLPIRPIPRVKTLVHDITTPECRAAIKREMRAHAHADVVLCDGAPNVGAAYDKDAFVQNEIALAALRCATQHLGPGGTFLTKVYRSSDYNALMWVFNQLFHSVQAIKPSSSRQQSAEIFVLCLKYRAPHSIDPKLLDPAYVFQEMEDAGGQSKVNIFSAQYDKQKRHRSGYEADAGMLLRRQGTVSAFVESEDPVQVLSDHSELVFDASCQPYLEHKLTTEEIKACLADLKVLGKGDFKALLKWRLKMREYREAMLKAAAALEGREAAEAAAEKEEKDKGKPKSAGEEEEEIQAEIAALQDLKAARAKRDRKRERERLAKLRVRQAYGMHHDAFDLPEHESIFSLQQIGDEGALETIRRGDFADVGDGADPDAEFGGEGDGDESDVDSDEEAARAARLEAELEESYQTYLSNRSEDGRAKGTRAAKRAKAAKAALAAEKMGEDMAMYDGDLSGYVELLSGKRKGAGGGGGEDTDSDTESDEEEAAAASSESEESEAGDGEAPAAAAGSEDEDEDDEGSEEEGGKKGAHPLLVDPSVFAGVEKSGAKVARWFSNPVFQGLMGGGLDGEEEEGEGEGDSGSEGPFDEESEDESGSEMEEEEEAVPVAAASNGKRKKGAAGAAGVAGAGSGGKFGSIAEEVLASMPKTDKQLRHEKRMKARERRERRAAKKQRLADPDAAEEERELELVAGDGTGEGEEGVQERDPAAAERARKRRDMIRAGMGVALEDEDGEGGKKGSKGVFEVVPATGPAVSMKMPKARMPPVADERAYDSEHEEWDEEERARTLAIATMMLRRSKAKELVDASYNRYAWNDAADLPDWFVDDEERHYRPQIPVPKALMEEMKQRFQTLAAKPIAKVAEARARKKRRALLRLKQAKAKASAIVHNPDMTERDKIRAIQKAVKGKGDLAARPDKVYAVVRKGGSSQAKGGAGGGGGRAKVKLVDKRMKKDARGMKKAMKGKGGKGGKKGRGRR